MSTDIRNEDEEAARGFAARDEPRWPATLAVIAAVALYVKLPDNLIFGAWSRWVLPLLEGSILVPLSVVFPRRPQTEGHIRRAFALGLIGLASAANLISLVLLVRLLLKGGSASGFQLVVSAIQIWVTNVLVFALWYWELDRGGPGKRCLPPEQRREPDFLFPQMVTPEAASPHWHPTFVDYLYVSFTNAEAFSPTDTMPLTPWAKLLMLVQSLASLVTVALVAARAINLLK